MFFCITIQLLITIKFNVLIKAVWPKRRLKYMSDFRVLNTLMLLFHP